MSFTVGENVGPYRITAQVGSGGMATVYKAYHAALDRYVAIKVLHPMFKEDPNFLARFQREARIVAKLEHAHIVPIYDFSEQAGQPYLVMRFVEGETLKARLQRGKLAISEVLDIMRPVCQAMTYAHEQGVLHRDVKPSNIILTPGGGVFLTDFGLAKMALSGESTLSHESLMGTPQYISPEQARGNADLDARTDIYSLGVVLYELLVGRVPFQADTPYAVVHDHIFTPLPMPRSLSPGLPEPLERVLLKALAKERDDRYATVAELLAALEKAASEAGPAVLSQAPPPSLQAAPPPAAPDAPTSISAAPPAPASTPAVPEAPAKPKSRRKLWIALGAVALLACCLLALVAAGAGQARQKLDNARQLRQEGRIEDALVQYDQARQANRKLLEAYVEPAQILLERGGPGDFERAADLCMQGLQAIGERNAGLHACAARAWMASGNLDGAAPHLEWLIGNRNYKEVWPHAAMAVVAAEHGDLARAQDEVRLAIERDPDALETQFAAGIVAARLHDPHLAREHLIRVIEAPEAPAWMRDRARMALESLDRQE